jgi:hypothetical protein
MGMPTVNPLPRLPLRLAGRRLHRPGQNLPTKRVEEVSLTEVNGLGYDGETVTRKTRRLGKWIKYREAGESSAGRWRLGTLGYTSQVFRVHSYQGGSLLNITFLMDGS